jgi:homoserine kinase
MKAEVNQYEDFRSLPQFSAQEDFQIRVPASIANLGPGFETLAVAVQMFVTLRVNKRKGHGQVQFNSSQAAQADVARIERAFRAIAGSEASRLPSLSVEVINEIPAGAGLGSSAALSVAGLRLYEAVARPVSIQKMLQTSAALGGNPESAAASLLGGLTLTCKLSDGALHAAKFPWPERLGLVLVTPVINRDLEHAPAGLPNLVSRDDLVFNLQRVALLLQSLRSADFSLLKHALDDRVHQPFSQGLIPGFSEALNLQHRDLLGVCLSGSGPSIVAMAERNLWEIGDLLAGIYRRTGIPYQLRILEAHQEISAQPQVFRSGLLCCS